MPNSGFYKNLVASTLPINELLISEDSFKDVPKDWHVVVTDIMGSTKAVENGLFQIVNAVASASIMTTLNVASPHNITIPFFFGGDGATILIPQSILSDTMDALILHQKNVQDNYDMHLRVDHISVSELYDNGCTIRLAKAKRSSVFDIPVILGDGLICAEQIIKARNLQNNTLSNEDATLNLEGMACQWNTIAPPTQDKEVVCLLFQALDKSQQGPIFKQILDQIDEVYGKVRARNPITVPKLELDTSIQKAKTELKVRKASPNLWDLVSLWIFTFFGKHIYFNVKAGKTYLKSIVELSDILVIDGNMNMVITGTAHQRMTLQRWLNDLEEKGIIRYGLFVNQESIISCYVKDLKSNHIHFVDGANGGYTKAAVMLKGKIAGM